MNGYQLATPALAAELVERLRAAGFDARVPDPILPGARPSRMLYTEAPLHVVTFMLMQCRTFHPADTSVGG